MDLDTIIDSMMLDGGETIAKIDYVRKLIGDSAHQNVFYREMGSGKLVEDLTLRGYHTRDGRSVVTIDYNNDRCKFVLLIVMILNNINYFF